MNAESVARGLRLKDDNTGCNHWLDGPTRTVQASWEVGRCAKCHNEVAYKVSAAGERTSEVRLVATS